ARRGAPAELHLGRHSQDGPRTQGDHGRDHRRARGSEKRKDQIGSEAGKRGVAMEQSVVDVKELSRWFGGKNALDRVSFRATAGQVYGLVGANGAGKTTLLKHLLGLLRAVTGSVRVFGLDPVRDPVGVLRRVGYLSEGRELPE